MTRISFDAVLIEDAMQQTGQPGLKNDNNNNNKVHTCMVCRSEANSFRLGPKRAAETKGSWVSPSSNVPSNPKSSGMT